MQKYWKIFGILAILRKNGSQSTLRFESFWEFVNKIAIGIGRNVLSSVPHAVIAPPKHLWLLQTQGLVRPSKFPSERNVGKPAIHISKIIKRWTIGFYDFTRYTFSIIWTLTDDCKIAKSEYLSTSRCHTFEPVKFEKWFVSIRKISKCLSFSRIIFQDSKKFGDAIVCVDIFSSICFSWNQPKKSKLEIYGILQTHFWQLYEKNLKVAIYKFSSTSFGCILSIAIFIPYKDARVKVRDVPTKRNLYLLSQIRALKNIHICFNFG